jgi:uncharacterized protein HemX
MDKNSDSLPLPIYLGDSPSSLGSCSSRSSFSSSTSITNVVKILTFILVGFAGGLLYHLVLNQQTISGHEQLLQANDQIVHQLASENQQHAAQLEQLQRQLQQQHQTTPRLRTNRNEVMHSIEEHDAHPERDPHAILWTHEVHDARLEAAHRQAEMLLRMRQQHDASEV